LSLTPYIDDGDQRIYSGDCIDVMAQLEASSVSVIITDPPYGLEFMGHKWDGFRRDDPGTGRNRGEYAGKHGELVDQADSSDRPARVGYGGGKRATTSRCARCGKRDQYRNAHEPCGAGEWRTEIVDPYAAPPTMLAFQEWTRTWALEAMRVLKPGAHLLAFGGTRTFHRLAAGLEDAGFEIRDCLTWLYGQGYPKSLDVSKAIDKEAGVAPTVVSETVKRHQRNRGGIVGTLVDEPRYDRITEPATPEAAAWEGWGTALKPAWEPIILARKPFAASVAKNVLDHGTGALNVKAARIAVDPADPVNDAVWVSRPSNFREGTVGFVTSNADGDRRSAAPPDEGRWPANLVLDPDAADQLDESAAGSGAGGHWPRARGEGGYMGGFQGQDGLDERHANGQGVSRFFYTAKASTGERNHGLDLPAVEHMRYGERDQGPRPQQTPHRPQRAANHHPTVKPLALMRWLVRLATPPGGVLLDPFLGSGTTLLAARAEGVRGIGIELDPDYLPIAAGRLAQQTLFALEADR
jgi:DNA modification methylase